MRRPRSWQDACAAALSCTNPKEVLGLIESAITSLERRYSEWSSTPGTPEELNAIQQYTSELQKKLASHSDIKRGAA